LKVVQFLALVLTALALVPAGAHLFALPNKINLAAEQYFIVQNIYRGWSLPASSSPARCRQPALAVLLRGWGRPQACAIASCIAVTLMIFFVQSIRQSAPPIGRASERLGRIALAMEICTPPMRS
jgi:hypothetical protein